MNLEKLNARIVFPITPNDGANLARTSFGLWIGGAGTITIDTPGSQNVVITVIAGSYLPVQVTKVYATGTTATLIVGMAP